MRSKFDEQLLQLNTEMIKLGALCENIIAMSAKALAEGNEVLAAEVTGISDKIERKERDIEEMCLRLLLQQQPVAGDLRVISSALKMVTDMERIGHQSADIAEILTTAHISPPDKSLPIHEMAQAAIKMVTGSVDAFVKKDVNAAREVIRYDDVVDAGFDRVKNALIEMLSRQGADGEYAVDLLMIAKYFERIGDHAVNIAGWVLFSITGERDSIS